jgi:hypothetical protein
MDEEDEVVLVCQPAMKLAEFLDMASDRRLHCSTTTLAQEFSHKERGMLRSKLLVFAIFSSLMVWWNNFAWAQFLDLTRRIPDGANALLLIDVDRLHGSRLAASEGWRNDHKKAYQAGLLLAPPQTSRLVGAAKVNFAWMETVWEMMLMNVNYDVPMANVALRFQGTVDRVSGRDVAVLPGNFYAVRFGPRVVAVGNKASRQDVARWINRVDNNSLRGLSPYLSEAQSNAEPDAQIIMAMDLSGAISAPIAERLLAEFETLKGKDVDLAAVSRALASARGLTLSILVGERRNGVLRVDFQEDISLIRDFAKPLLLEVLAYHGAVIDELSDWAYTVSGKRIEIRGQFNQSGMRRVMSLLDAPPPLQESAQQVDPGSPASGQQLELLATQSYFNSVVSLVDDLRGDKRQRRTMGQIGVWFRQYARRIDRLPILNVHPSMLDYGEFVASLLRGGQLDIQDAAASSRVGQQSAWRSGRHGWSDRTRVRTHERIRGTMSANMILQAIDVATADIRRYMTQKFNVQF